MPTIEILETLSTMFHMSVNELICGERLSDEQLRKGTDIHLVAACKSNHFSLKEQISFWKKKWLKEHILLLTIGILICLSVFLFAVIKGIEFLIGGSMILVILMYLYIRNKMMIYIEANAFDPHL